MMKTKKKLKIVHYLQNYLKRISTKSFLIGPLKHHFVSKLLEPDSEFIQSKIK